MWTVTVFGCDGSLLAEYEFPNQPDYDRGKNSVQGTTKDGSFVILMGGENLIIIESNKKDKEE